MRVVAIGECMVEFAPTGDGKFAMGFAGDTFNTAWYLRRLMPADASVAYLSAVGADAVSDQMTSFMATEGIDTDPIRRVPGRSVGLYVIQLAAGERTFAYWRSTSAARLLADDPDWLHRALAGAGLIYLSGITLAILSPDGRERLMAALARARVAGATVAFDPNIRATLWPDAATLRQTISDMATAADIVLPSHEDEARHFGDADPAATAQRYAACGAALVVVKDGPRPVVTLQGGKIDLHPVPAPTAPVQDTTAAGDSFNAGFLASHLAGTPLAGAIAAGTRLAGRVIAGPGALVRSAVTPAP